MTSGSNCRHLNKPQTEDARRSIQLPYHRVTAKLQHFRPVATDCAAYRRQLTIDTKSCCTEMLGDLTANYNGIPRSYYRFGASESPLPYFPRDDRLEPRA